MRADEKKGRLRVLKDLRYVTRRLEINNAPPKVSAAFLGIASSLSISLVLITFTAFGNIPYVWAVSMLVAMSVGGIAYRRCRFPDWESQAFEMLLAYDPIDKEAFQHLQKQITADIPLPEVLDTWEVAERRAILGKKVAPSAQAKAKLLDRKFSV